MRVLLRVGVGYIGCVYWVVRNLVVLYSSDADLLTPGTGTLVVEEEEKGRYSCASAAGRRKLGRGGRIWAWGRGQL